MSSEALRHVQSAAGATFADPARAPIDYGDRSAEYRSARESAALIDLTHRDHLELAGSDRVTFLNNFCTNDIKRLEPGSGCEAFVTSIKGRILAHVLVFAGESVLWIDTGEGSSTTLDGHLNKYLITEQVSITDCSATWGEFALTGPRAGDIADTIVPGAAAFDEFRHASNGEFVIRRCDLFGQPTWLCGAGVSHLPELWERLRAGGAVPCGDAAAEALRIEAKFPRDGVDLTEDNLAHEAARTARAISFTKGCYLGQEPIARLESMGHTNRELRGLKISGTEPPAAGTPVLDSSGTQVGVITSAAAVPGSDSSVALAMLKRAACEAGTALTVAAGESLSATV